MERMWASESDLFWWSYQAPPSTGLICPMRLHKPTSGAVREAMASDRPPAQCLAWCFLGQKGRISTFLWIVPPCQAETGPQLQGALVALSCLNFSLLPSTSMVSARLLLSCIPNPNPLLPR